MDINNELKEVIKREVLIKKELEEAKEYAGRQRSRTRKSIELLKDQRHLRELIELEC